MTNSESEDVEVLAVFSTEQGASIAAHAASLELSLPEYVQWSATRRAEDWQLKERLVKEAAAMRGNARQLSPGLDLFVADFPDQQGAPAPLTDQEREMRAREAARECGIDYTDEVRAFGKAILARIEAHQAQAAKGEANPESG
ncbi:hypothetical protein [Streptomyces sp. N35]|uniref:hypothetical protein n=1 Tax=Streptomyces sp. N35 TaxID=2795730 RepID=UPI0018F54DA9|nr:hypothetical protein [Streptomyces sp. N35]